MNQGGGMPIDTISVPTKEEVRARILSRKKADFFGFEINEYYDYCGWDWLMENDFLKKEAKRTECFDKNIDRNAVLEEMKNYMSFAFEKANNERGLSANRSIAHYVAWVWLSGEPEFSKEIDEKFKSEYCDYGKHILQSICEHYGWQAV